MPTANVRTAALAVAVLALVSCGNDGPAGPDLTRNTTAEGRHSYETLDIPAGVTITVTGPLTLDVAGAVSIAGTLTGDCVPITINGNSTLALSGTIRNACSTLLPGDGPAPALTVVGNGDMMIDGATIVSSGDVEIRNDPALTEAAFAVPPAPGTSPRSALSSSPASAGRAITFVVTNTTYTPDPVRARNGLHAAQATNGEDASNFRLLAQGDLIVGGGVVLRGQHGGHGGSAMHRGAPADARGGHGGDGGRIAILATGELAIGGAQNQLISGSGGDAGRAESFADPGPGARAPDATSTGGDGGDPGLIRIEGQQGLTINSGLTLTVGVGGSGGVAIAFGANGDPAICADGHAQHGGHAEARGGRGGSSPDRKLRELGSTTLNASPFVQGGHGGEGGHAAARAGDGATATDCENCKDGGDGGNLEAWGGAGGHARIRNLDNDPIGDGGDGGSTLHYFGNGGNGANCCDPTPRPGGNGGAGGNAIGGDGARGTGKTPGAFGGVTIGSGTGGDAGVGSPAGTKGTGGTNRTAVQPSTTQGTTKFADGLPANACSPAPPGNAIAGTYMLSASRTSTSGPCSFAPSFTNPNVHIDFDGTNVIVRSDADVSGQYDPATGQWQGVGPPHRMHPATGCANPSKACGRRATTARSGSTAFSRTSCWRRTGP